MLPEIRPSPASQFLSLAVAVGQAHKAAGHLSPVAGEAVRLTIAGIARERWSLRASVPSGALRRAGERRLCRQAGRRRPLARRNRSGHGAPGPMELPRYDGLLQPGPGKSVLTNDRYSDTTGHSVWSTALAWLGAPGVGQALAKSAMTCGAEASKPTTSSIPASSGSAMVNSLEVMATTAILAGMPVCSRY